MNIFYRTPEFDKWLHKLKDIRAKARIAQRLDSAALGNWGDTKPVGEGVSELRFHFGAGYRIYYTRVGNTVYWLLIGGDKSSQKDDITKAKELAKEYKEQENG